MKKSANLFFAVAAVAMALFMFGAEAKARITGYLYGDALVIGYPGTTVASISEAGALAATGLTNTGAMSNVGAITVATSATSGYSLVFKGAVVTLSTQPAVVGEIWLQTSDLKVYVSTRVPAANVTYCNTTGCYSAFN